nr:ATP-binding protein [Streptomyces zingiberis]
MCGVPAGPRFTGSPVEPFTLRFSSTPRGARLARRLAGEWLDRCGVGYGSAGHDAVTLVVAELAANAARHGCVPGRDFRVRLTAGAGRVRVEVTDPRGERLPAPSPAPGEVGGAGEDGDGGGFGLLLVAAVAIRWGWRPREDGPGKTVWADCAVPGP